MYNIKKTLILVLLIHRENEIGYEFVDDYLLLSSIHNL